MPWLPAVLKVLKLAPTVISAVSEAVSAWRKLRPKKKPAAQEPEPMPLSHSDVDHIETQIRSATSPRAIAPTDNKGR
jgi:hypothetical protein